MSITKVRIHAMISSPGSLEFLAGYFEMPTSGGPFLGQEFNLPGIRRPVFVREFVTLESGLANVRAFRHIGRSIPDDQIAETDRGLSELQDLGWTFTASAS